MTAKEHQLVIAMLAKQALAIRTLEEILRSNNLLTDETLEGIRNSVDYSESENPDVIPQTTDFYEKTAKLLGVNLHG